MAQTRINPTRMELGKLKKRLKTARRGHKLLKDKRDELMKQFMNTVRDNMALRKKVEESLAKLSDSFSVAAALTSRKIIDEALIYPKITTDIEVKSKNIMSVEVPVFEFGEDALENADITSYGFAFTPAELDEALEYLVRILPDMIKLAEVEKTSQMLSDQIEKTRRRVNALEYIMIPQIEANIKTITMKLDENERGNTTRLMKVKDMMINR